MPGNGRRSRFASVDPAPWGLRRQPPQLQHALDAAVRAMERFAASHRLSHQLVEVLGCEIEIPRPKHLHQPLRFCLGNARRTHTSSPERPALPRPDPRRRPAIDGNDAHSIPVDPQPQRNPVAPHDARRSHPIHAPFEPPATCDLPVQKPDKPRAT